VSRPTFAEIGVLAALVVHVEDELENAQFHLKKLKDCLSAAPLEKQWAESEEADDA
jgi:hypothetical protein